MTLLLTQQSQAGTATAWHHRRYRQLVGRRCQELPHAIQRWGRMALGILRRTRRRCRTARGSVAVYLHKKIMKQQRACFLCLVLVPRFLRYVSISLCLLPLRPFVLSACHYPSVLLRAGASGKEPKLPLLREALRPHAGTQRRSPCITQLCVL